MFSNSTFIIFCETAALVDLSDLGYVNKKISYRASIGNFTLREINGIDYQTETIPQNITVDTVNHSNYTSVEISGAIDSILIGGFEGGFDDFCISEDVTNSTISQNEKTFSVYPNPANNILNILNSKENSLNTIYSINGSQVYSGYSLHIDISRLQSGIYFIKNDNGLTKFVKD